MKSMAMVLITVLAATPVWGQATKPAEKSDIQVEPCGLGVSNPEAAKKYGSYLSFTTQVWFGLVSQKVSFVSVVQEKSRLISFTDDKGTDLANKNADPARPPFWAAAVSPDRRAFQLTYDGGGRPAPGATAVKLKAELAMLCGFGEKTAEQKDVELANGSTVAGGLFPLTLAEVRKVGPANNRMTQVTLKGKSTKEDCDRIRSISFFDGDGKEIKSSLLGVGGHHVPLRGEFSSLYELHGAPASATVRVTYFEKVEERKVPVDLSIGIGL